MKKLITLVAVSLVSIAASADDVRFQLPKNATGLYPITKVEVSTAPMCPKGVTCITDGTTVTLGFRLRNCADSLGPVSYRVEETRKQINLYVSALATYGEPQMRCFPPAPVKVVLPLIGKFGKVNVIPLEGSASNLQTAESDPTRRILPGESVALATLDSIQNVQISDLCPPGARCFVGGTSVRLTFMLPGCLDKLGPVSFKTEQTKKGTKLIVSAVAIENAKSAVVKCFAPAYETVTLPLIGRFDVQTPVVLSKAVVPATRQN